LGHPERQSGNDKEVKDLPNIRIKLPPTAFSNEEWITSKMMNASNFCKLLGEHALNMRHNWLEVLTKGVM